MKEETFHSLFSCKPRTTLNNNDVEGLSNSKLRFMGKKKVISQSKNSHFENEAKCKTIVAKKSFIYNRIKNIFISLASIA